MNAKFSIRVCTDVGQEVLRADVSTREAVSIMREACANPEFQAVWATRIRPDGSPQIVYLCELEERLSCVD